MSDHGNIRAGTSPVARPHIAIVCDLLEDNWPSMDLVGDMLLRYLRERHASSFHPELLRPAFARCFTPLAKVGDSKLAYSADRFLNRFLKYPQWVEQRKREFELFHIIDHSYAHLACKLPAERTVVTCHDLDAFRWLVEPVRSIRSRVLRALASRLLNGLTNAARVICDSVATRDELLAHGWVAPEKMVVINLGAHPACSPHPDRIPDLEAGKLLARAPRRLYVLHVGSTIERKRIDVLLLSIAAVKKEFPDLVLLRAGGPFTLAQRGLISKLGLEKSILVLPFLSRSTLAAVYRKSALLMLPSEREGFGLPVAEAMACGVPVVASDIPALREVGGDAALYCSLGDVQAFSEAITKLLHDFIGHSPAWRQRRQAALIQSQRFSWSQHADRTVSVYNQILLDGRQSG